MLTLEFRNLIGAPTVVGPLPLVRVSLGVMLDAQGTAIAAYTEPCWIVAGKPYLTMHCADPALLHFSSPGAGLVESGPFRHVLLSDGIIYGDSAGIATLRRADLQWVIISGGDVLQDLIIQPSGIGSSPSGS